MLRIDSDGGESREDSASASADSGSDDAIGNVTVHGDVYGSFITTRQSHIGNITIDGSLIGTARVHSGTIGSGGTLGAVVIGGSVLGGSAANTGQVTAKGFITSLDGGRLRAVGFIVNCPVVYRVN